MRVVKIGKIIMYNQSSIISNDEIYECIKLLTKEYQKLDTHVYIHKDYKSYLSFCLRKLRFNDLLMNVIKQAFEKVNGSTITLGVYKPYRDEIHLYEYQIHKFLIVVKRKIMETEEAKYITTDIWEKYENMWTKYILFYNLLHELQHAQQKSKKEINLGLKNRMIKWGYRKHEIDSAKRSERIYKKYGERFNKILKTEGIKVYHRFENGLDIGYEYSMEVDSD